MTIQQPTQQVFNGVVVGFAMIVDGVQPTGPSHRKYDTQEEMMIAYERLQDGAFKAGWDEPIPTEFKVRFKTEAGEEEDVNLSDYYAPHLAKSDPAKKVLCKCGAVAWRITKSDPSTAVPLFVCDDCRDQDTIDEVGYLQEIDADPRDYPQ